MRPPRIAILVFSIAASLFILYRGLTTTRPNAVASYPSTVRASRSVFGFMYYNTPFSLFPPNAAISLTDDNSTSFAARPAAFGPKLASRGLSAQLWVGSGFGDDGLDTDGELGCSDLPGWGSSNTRASLRNSFKAGSTRITSVRSKVPKNGGSLLDPDDRRDSVAKAKARSKNDKYDNTDDYLTEEVSGTLPRRDASSGSSAHAAHADIQSIQEAAEIEGKVVLLKRGGCGFLEKVMWAQRRGAIAVIVGDNQKGGPLIQMFAHGDEVDNVTVPSVFTARTTAQLLSSLTQLGSFVEDTIDDDGNPMLKVQQSATAKHRKRSPVDSNAADSKAKPSTDEKKKKQPLKPSLAKSKTGQGRGILQGVFKSNSAHHVSPESRPPSSGRLDWVLVEDWNDEKDKMVSEAMGIAKTPKDKSNGDEFVIGVHDWRDPDLVVSSGKHEYEEKATSKQTEANKGGSTGSNSDRASSKESEGISKNHSLMSKLFGSGDSNTAPDDPKTPLPASHESADPQGPPPQSGKRPTHEGLWVTITPTSSASPFFDTLLVLVISPLVTLTVVYALLILRARIRRRRWRAPKSVVDQLPVRTYHTVSSTTSNLSPRLPSPEIATPMTPLLQHGPSRSRPRSRTTTGVMESPNFPAPSAAIPAPQEPSRANRRSGFEKGAGGFSAEWRKYMGRQVECVVCLEEYVDGVSRVMSLPCGHEFHVDCITPWLTTRRRTCPICKGDVVQSLQRGRGNRPRYEPYREDSDEDEDEDEVDEAEASGTGFAERERNVDLEQGIANAEARTSPRATQREGGGWLGIFSSNFNGRSTPEHRSPSPEHRSR